MKSNTVREGSIPMVMIVVVCLGIVAGAAIFNTGTSARMDKKSELNQAAWIIAQAAVEETIVKCSNGTAAPVADKRQTFPAEVTFATIGTPDAVIAPVELVARTIEDKGDKPNPDAEKAIRQLSALVPGFFKKDNPNGVANLQDTLKTFKDADGKDPANVDMCYDVDWREKMLKAPAGTFDPMLLKAIEVAYSYKDASGTVVKVPAIGFNRAALSGKADDFAKANIDNGGNAESDNANNPVHPKVLSLFQKIPSLTYLGKFDPATAATLKHSPQDLAQFKTAFSDATEAISDHMQSRINGCNGDFNYAIGGMLTGLGRGTPCKNDSDAGEETYRKQSEESGLTKYKEGLLTVSTKVKFTRGTMSAEQQYTAHRIMRQMNLNTIMVDVGKSMLGYLHGYYNLTRADLIELGFLGKPTPKDPKTNPDGLPDAAASTDLDKPDYIPTATAQMFMVMNDRFNVYSGNTQVRNAQLANCLGAPK